MECHDLNTLCRDALLLYMLISGGLKKHSTYSTDFESLQFAITKCIEVVKSMSNHDSDCAENVSDDMISADDVLPSVAVIDFTSACCSFESGVFGITLSSSARFYNRKRLADNRTLGLKKSSEKPLVDNKRQAVLNYVSPQFESTYKLSTGVKNNLEMSDSVQLQSSLVCETVESTSASQIASTDVLSMVDSTPVLKRQSLLPAAVVAFDDVMVEITHLEVLKSERCKDVRYLALSAMFNEEWSTMASLYGFHSEHCQLIHKLLLEAHHWDRKQVVLRYSSCTASLFLY